MFKMEGGKGKRGSAWCFRQQFKNKAKNRVDDLQGMFTDLQQARKENRMTDVTLLEEQVHQMLREWKAELHEASPASSLLAESLSSSELSSDMKRLLQLHEEDDDASSSPKIQLDGSALRANNTADYQADCLVDDLHTPEQAFERVSKYTDIGEELHQNSYLQTLEQLPANIEEQEKKNYVQTSQHLPPSLVEGLEVTAGLQGGQIDFHQDYIPVAQPIFTLNGEEETSPIFHGPQPGLCPPPAAFLGPKCALWDCSRPAQGTKWCQYELWKPYLRAMMECDMKAVSIGSKSKAEVLETCLQQMKSCFLDTKSNKEKLFEAMELFFERSQTAGGDDHRTIGEIVSRCQVCQESDMALKKKPDGKFMVGCQNFPQCRNAVWLPGSISEASVTNQLCDTCGPGPVFKIQFKFRRMEIPVQYSTEHLGCIGGCDRILRELIDICGTGSRNSFTGSARGQQPTQAPRNNRTQAPGNSRTRNSRQSLCLHCRQPGHSSNECPQQAPRPQGRQVGHSSNELPRQPQRHRAGSTGTQEVLCESCQMPCPLRTANTENNRGRRFYTCQTRSCNFFKWEDSIQTANASAGRNRGGTNGEGNGRRRVNRTNSRSDRGGRGDGNFVSATGEEVVRRCFVCGDPSHFANACPNRAT